MKRLTTDAPQGNFETMLNYVYGSGGWTYIRSDGELDGVPLTDWARKQCLLRGCDELPAQTAQEIDETICDCMMDYPGCPVALAYCFACQAVHLRGRLKQYEDILFDAAGKELLPLNELRKLASNTTLTLEELRRLASVGRAVWCVDTDGVRQGLLCIQEHWADSRKCPHIWLLNEEGGSNVYNVETMLELGAVFCLRRPEEGTA